MFLWDSCRCCQTFSVAVMLHTGQQRRALNWRGIFIITVFTIKESGFDYAHNNGFCRASSLGSVKPANVSEYFSCHNYYQNIPLGERMRCVAQDTDCGRMHGLNRTCQNIDLNASHLENHVSMTTVESLIKILHTGLPDGSGTVGMGTEISRDIVPPVKALVRAGCRGRCEATRVSQMELDQFLLWLKMFASRVLSIIAQSPDPPKIRRVPLSCPDFINSLPW